MKISEQIGLVAERSKLELDEIRKGGTVINTGIAALDNNISITMGSYTIIGARTATGKTALATQIVFKAVNDMEQGITPSGTVAIFSAEMTNTRMLLREVAARVGVSLSDLAKTPEEIPDETWNELYSRLDSFRDNDWVYMNDTGAPTLDFVRNVLEGMPKPLRLVVVDYMELVGDWDKNEALRMNKISNGLLEISNTYNVAVIALAQLKREVEQRASSDYMLFSSDLNQGGEKAADNIVMMVRPWLYSPEDYPSPYVKGYIAKARYGPTSSFDLYFDGPSMRFTTGSLERISLNGDEQPIW